MTHFICPVCHGKLEEKNKSLVCSLGHCFDISSKGYVNLLSGVKGGIHGDDKEMCRKRRDFLDCGYYAPLRNKLCDFAKKYIENGSIILDAGCGEGYYTEGISEKLDEKGTEHSFLCVDISKDAVSMCAKRKKSLKTAVCSVYDLPLADNGVDCIFSIFSPFAIDEFTRILKPNGILIIAFPDRRHLFSLKEAIYDEPYENEVQPIEINGYEVLCKENVCSDIRIDNNEMIKALFGMTPYRYKTSSAGLARLDTLCKLETKAEFITVVYRKK